MSSFRKKTENKYEAVPNDSDTATESDALTGKKPKKKKKKQEIRNCFTFYLWFKRDPLGRWPIVYFILSFIGSLVLIGLYVLNRETGPGNYYLFLGILGFTTSLTGYRQFKLIIGLMVGVDNMVENNKKFAVENRHLSVEVNRLKATVNELKATRIKLTGGITDLRENIDKLDQLNENLERYNVSNIQEVGNLMKKAKQMGKKWKDELVMNERNLLHSIFDKFELMDAEEGMSIDEYRHFCRKLPERYMAKIVKLDFFNYYKNDQNLLNFAEFGMALDILADLEIRGLPMKKFPDLFAEQMRQNNDDNYYVRAMSGKGNNNE